MIILRPYHPVLVSLIHGHTVTWVSFKWWWQQSVTECSPFFLIATYQTYSQFVHRSLNSHFLAQTQNICICVVSWLIAVTLHCDEPVLRLIYIGSMQTGNTPWSVCDMLWSPTDRFIHLHLGHYQTLLSKTTSFIHTFLHWRWWLPCKLPLSLALCNCF